VSDKERQHPVCGHADNRQPGVFQREIPKTKNYVAQQLAANNIRLYYWASNYTAEINFILQLKEYAIPTECKSSDNVRSRSLNVYTSKYTPPYTIRIPSKNFGFENEIKSVPLYAVFCIK